MGIELIEYIRAWPDARYRDAGQVAGRIHREHRHTAEEQARHRQVRCERHAVHALAIAVGGNGACHVRTVGNELRPFEQAVLMQELQLRRRECRIEQQIVDCNLVALTAEAGRGPRQHCRVAAQTAIGQHVGQVQAAIVLAGKLVMVQAAAAVKHAQTHAFAGQAACIGGIGVDCLQAPIGIELIVAPLGDIARIRSRCSRYAGGRVGFVCSRRPLHKGGLHGTLPEVLLQRVR